MIEPALKISMINATSAISIIETIDQNIAGCNSATFATVVPSCVNSGVALSRKRSRSRTKSSSTNHSSNKSITDSTSMESIAITTAITKSPATNDNSMEKKEAGQILPWEKHYAALCQYGKEHGHCNIPQKEVYECELKDFLAAEDNTDDDNETTGGVFHYKAKLGYWLHTQRSSKKGSILNDQQRIKDGKASRTLSLSTERDALLQRLVDEGKLLWDASSQMGGAKVAQQGDADWPRHYAALLQYYTQYGHCNVPTRIVYECGITSAQLPSLLESDSASAHTGVNYHHNNDQSTSMDISSRSNKNSNNPNIITVATPSSHIHTVLEPMNKHITATLTSTTTTTTTTGDDDDDDGDDDDGKNSNNTNNIHHYRGNLGTWLSTQRRAQKRQGHARLSEVKLKLLQKLVDEGKLQWDCSNERVNVKKRQQGDYDWPRNYAALVAYGAQHGHCNVPKRDSYQCLVPCVMRSDTKTCTNETRHSLKNNDENNTSCDDDKEEEDDIHHISSTFPNELFPLSVHTNYSGSSMISDAGDNDDDNDGDDDAVASGNNDTSNSFSHSNSNDLSNINDAHRGLPLPLQTSLSQPHTEMEIYHCKLGNWLHTQRCAKRDQIAQQKSRYTFLTPEREVLLQSLVDQGLLLWDASAHRPLGLRYCTRRPKTSGTGRNNTSHIITSKSSDNVSAALVALKQSTSSSSSSFAALSPSSSSSSAALSSSSLVHVTDPLSSTMAHPPQSQREPEVLTVELLKQTSSLPSPLPSSSAAAVRTDESTELLSHNDHNDDHNNRVSNYTDVNSIIFNTTTNNSNSVSSIIIHHDGASITTNTAQEVSKSTGAATMAAIVATVALITQ